MKNLEEKKIKSFGNLKKGDKIISPLDNEVTGVYVYPDGDMYLESSRCLFAVGQFDPEDYYFYDGEKEIGELDKEYFE